MSEHPRVTIIQGQDLTGCARCIAKCEKCGKRSEPWLDSDDARAQLADILCGEIVVLASPCSVCFTEHPMPECVETDIVRRLRDRPTRRADPDGIAEDAADEIEALRRKVATAEKFLDGLNGCPVDCLGACPSCGSKRDHLADCEWIAFRAAVSP